MNSLFYEKTIKDRIRKKLVETEATSLQKAVTIIEAKFDDEEQNWLICIRRRTIFSSEENKRQTILYRRLTVYDRTLSDFEPLSSIKRNLDLSFLPSYLGDPLLCFEKTLECIQKS